MTKILPDSAHLAESWHIERTFAWLGNFRRLVVRWERRVNIYLAFLVIACFRVFLGAILG